jgi:16S rRNA (cytosine967-C5)-methyltransferase
MERRSATEVIKDEHPDTRAAVQSLLFLSLRYWGTAQVFKSMLVDRQPTPKIDFLLGTALSLMAPESGAPYETHTLVNQAVEATKQVRSLNAQGPFLNAVLRRFLREEASIREAAKKNEVGLYNHPEWWIEQLKIDHPNHWEEILQVAQDPAPMTLRVNATLTHTSDFSGALSNKGMAHQLLNDRHPDALILSQPKGVKEIPGFLEGWFSVQDAAAQLAAPLLMNAMKDVGLLTGTRELNLLDACAAPGGKTAHWLEALETDALTQGGNRFAQKRTSTKANDRKQRLTWGLHAVEFDARRSERILENLERLRLDAPIWIGDAAKPEKWVHFEAQDLKGVPEQAPMRYDAILLDAPCSASGIVRRHPDIRWLRQKGDLKSLGLQQKRLLKALWAHLEPGGLLLYCTCSVFRAEGETQIDSFLQHNSDALLRPSPGHLIPHKLINEPRVLDNQMCDQDGFYYALLQKRPL